MMSSQYNDRTLLATTRQVLAQFAEDLERAGIVAAEPELKIRREDPREYESEITVWFYNRSDGDVYDVLEFHSVWHGEPYTTDEDLRVWLRNNLSEICARNAG